MSLLLSLHANDSVLLNGRHAGDTEGQFTCCTRWGTGAGGSSGVDYAIVSADLFPAVHHFQVLSFDPLVSHDHCALSIAFHLADVVLNHVALESLSILVHMLQRFVSMSASYPHCLSSCNTADVQLMWRFHN